LNKKGHCQGLRKKVRSEQVPKKEQKEAEKDCRYGPAELAIKETGKNHRSQASSKEKKDEAQSDPAGKMASEEHLLHYSKKKKATDKLKRA